MIFTELFETKTSALTEGVRVIDQDYDLDQLILTMDINGRRVSFTYTDYDEDFDNAERGDVHDQLQRNDWYAALSHPDRMEILDAAYRAIRGVEPGEYRPTVDDEPMDVVDRLGEQGAPEDRDLGEQRYKFQRIKFRGTDHDIGEERYRFVINGDTIFFNFPSDEDNPDPDSPSFEEILARVQRSGEVRHYRITPAEQQAIAKKIAAERQRYLDQRRLDVSEGHADQQRKIVKKNGKPVGEIGIDRESSPGAGMYYMKHYASGLDLGGYDSREEAMDELRYAVKQGVSEAMKPSDIPPGMRDRLTMRNIEAERPAGAFRFRVTFPDGHANDYMTFDAAKSAADRAKGRITRLSETQKTVHKGAKGSNPRLERILKMLRANHPQAQNDLEALILDFRGQQAQDRSDISRLDAENDAEEEDIARLERMLAILKQRSRLAEYSAKKKDLGLSVSRDQDENIVMAEAKRDACYRKVKSRYKVWPSAYASGALVQCRKQGAANWGTGGKKK